MTRPVRQHARISEDTLQDAFPFIRYGDSASLAPEHVSRAVNEVRPKPAAATAVQRKEFPAELFRDLTKRDIQHVLEILHCSLQATTGDDAYQLLRLIQHVVECPRVIGGVVQLNSQGNFQEFSNVINVSYSNDWLYTYGRNGYASVDPVLQRVLTTFETQVWEQTYKTATSPKEIEFIEEACSYGLTHGITTSMPERGSGFASFFSFAGGDIENTTRCKGLLEYLLPILHRLVIANTNTASPHRARVLSPREMVVLDWMRQGQTNWEISRIIGVTERTVRFHVESIFMKLDVGSRTQAVAFAIEHGLLTSE